MHHIFFRKVFKKPFATIGLVLAFGLVGGTAFDSITQSFEKDGLFLTFGVENIYSGSSDNKKITGYRAYIEHN